MWVTCNHVNLIEYITHKEKEAPSSIPRLHLKRKVFLLQTTSPALTGLEIGILTPSGTIGGVTTEIIGIGVFT